MSKVILVSSGFSSKIIRDKVLELLKKEDLEVEVLDLNKKSDLRIIDMGKVDSFIDNMTFVDPWETHEKKYGEPE